MGKRIQNIADFSRFVWSHYKQGYKDTIEKHNIPIDNILFSWSRFTIAVSFSAGVQILFFSCPPFMALFISLATMSFLEMVASELRYAQKIKYIKNINKLLLELKDACDDSEKKKSEKVE